MRVPSMSVAGTTYEAERTANGWRCSCPAYQMSPRGQKGCKHVELVQTAERLIARCGHAEGLCHGCLVELLAVTGRKTGIFRQAMKRLKGRAE